MKKVPSLLALASLSVSLVAHAVPYADSVTSYTSGTGTLAGYNNPNSALGSPTRSYTDPYGTWGVDPFASAYQGSELVSIGAGGSLTVGFSTPVLNNTANPYGLDFIIFGNSFLQAPGPNYDTANGQIGGNNSGSTEVFVSADGVAFYRLNPSLAPVVDGFAPTDGAGDFTRPLNPSLTPTSFNGLKMGGIRSLYNGSGGGTAYDLAWAQDINGNAVLLPGVSFIRVNVLNGVSEIDGFSTVAVPEPSSFALAMLAGFGFLIHRRHFGRKNAVEIGAERQLRPTINGGAALPRSPLSLTQGCGRTP